MQVILHKSTSAKILFYVFFQRDSNHVTFLQRLLRGRLFVNVPGTKKRGKQKGLTSKSCAEMHENVVIWVPIFDVFAFQWSRCTVQFRL